ncbi:MAG: hypothetical protein ACREL7_10760 [Longimicrobiales bacterium]
MRLRSRDSRLISTAPYDAFTTCRTPVVVQCASGVAHRTWPDAFAIALAVVVTLPACSDAVPRELLPAVDSAALLVPARVEELFVARADSQSDLSGLASWAVDGSQQWLLTTAPASNSIQVRRESDGSLVSEYRRTGRGAGALREPVSLAVVDSFAFVVERGNHRVQAFRLPGFESAGSFGAEELIAPQWIAMVQQGDAIDLYVSDREDAGVEGAPPGALIRLFRVTRLGDRFQAGLMRSFGTDAGLGDVAAIAIDSVHDRVLVADRNVGVVAFSLAGDAVGMSIPANVFAGAPTALALHRCGRDAGHWLVTDTAHSFHVFDRATLVPATRFWGRTLSPTADILVIPGAQPDGSILISIHARHSIGALAWSAIADSIPALRSCEAGLPAV